MRAGQRVETRGLRPSGSVPNSILPVLVYRMALDPGSAYLAQELEGLFARHGWGNAWRNGVYPFHHYHSTSHEVLGIAAGEAVLRLGGETGQDVHLAAGDVVALPAGVGHKRQQASKEFLVVGAYPDGLDWDLIRADEVSADVVQAATERIAALPLPAADPVLGEGGLRTIWLAAHGRRRQPEAGR